METCILLTIVQEAFATWIGTSVSIWVVLARCTIFTTCFRGHLEVKLSHAMLISITHRIFMHFPLRVDYIVSIWFVLNPVAIVTAIITTTSTSTRRTWSDSQTLGHNCCTLDIMTMPYNAYVAMRPASLPIGDLEPRKQLRKKLNCKDRDGQGEKLLWWLPEPSHQAYLVQLGSILIHRWSTIVNYDSNW